LKGIAVRQHGEVAFLVRGCWWCRRKAPLVDTIYDLLIC
jgi:hypothetical protein